MNSLNEHNGRISVILGIASLILIFLGGPFAGLGKVKIAYGFLFGAITIAIIGLLQGINKLKSKRKIPALIGIIICLIALFLSIYSGLIDFVMRNY